MLGSEDRDWLLQEAAGCLSESDAAWGAIRAALVMVKRHTHADAVGLRVAEGDDFPYRYSNGFSDAFIRKENSLLPVLSSGERALELPLACTCGLVLSGRLDPNHPLSAPGGGALCNDARTLLRLSRDADPRSCPRNECVHAGFRSLALIPVRASGKTIGLLQLNKRITDGFDRRRLESIGKFCDRLGPAIWRAQQIRDDARVAGVSSDVSRQRDMELAKQELYAQLLHAQKLEAIGRMAGAIAHDFNNILTAMTLQLDILRASACTREGEEDIGPLVDDLSLAAERASSLTRKLLLFCRRETASQTQAACDVTQVIFDLMPLLKRLVGADVSVRVECGTEPLMIRVDASMVEQVLMNLCINARDAMIDRKEICISASREDWPARVPRATGTPPQPEVFVVIRVRDSGSGIEAEILPHIFEPFFTTKDSTKGTGLGLSTVHGIVTSHHGWIEVDTKIGEGTAFSVYFPWDARALVNRDGTP